MWLCAVVCVCACVCGVWLYVVVCCCVLLCVWLCVCVCVVCVWCVCGCYKVRPSSAKSVLELAFVLPSVGLALASKVIIAEVVIKIKLGIPYVCVVTCVVVVV